MLFSSPAFFVFFVVYFIVHYFVPSRYRLYLIILGSTIFYAWWKIDFAWLPYFLMATAFIGGHWLDRARTPKLRRRRLTLSIIVLFLPLAFYKYTDFLYADVIGPFFGVHHGVINLPLPLGVSFVTFTLTAYLVDIHNRNFAADHRPRSVLAYVLFFPHLIAGPILRPRELIPQLEHPRTATLKRATVPLAIFSVGLVKKLVFADPMGAVVNGIYGRGTPPTAYEAWLALIGFAVQIYCDFSGYTDMAIGLAALLGVKLPNNFRQPYASRTISEVWRRWHMTLMRFLSDYVYSPISLALTRYAVKRRMGKWAMFAVSVVVPVNITFFLSGLWHGAGWNFIMFGVVTGVAITLEFAWRRARMPGVPNLLAWLLTAIVFLISLAFFRAHDLGKAVSVLSAAVSGDWEGSGAFAIDSVFPLSLIAVFALTHRFDDHRRIRLAIRYSRPEFVWVTIAFAWVLAITISQGSSGNFVYFDF